MTALPQAPPRSCTCKSPKTNGRIWNGIPRPATWTATIPLKEGASRIDFFSNHGHMANGYQQYLSSPYTRVELSPSEWRKYSSRSDTNKDGKLNEFRQSRGIGARTAKPTQAGDAKLTETRAVFAQKGGGPDQQRSNLLDVWKETQRRVVISSPSKHAFRKWMPTRME